MGMGSLLSSSPDLYETTLPSRPYFAGEFRPDRNTRKSVPYSFRIVCVILQCVRDEGSY